MNRSAYLTTGLAIKAFSGLSKADVVVHGKDNLPAGPKIFVMNHFTRVETFLLPYYIYNITGKPVWSLAAAELFKGALRKYFDMIGVVSTRDPQRDELIVRSLLTGEADWNIFPEGAMVKTKKIMANGKYMIAHPEGLREPRTGAAALGLRAELYREYLLEDGEKSPDQLNSSLAALGLTSLDQVVRQETSIVPVNLTYYPIRAAENIALDIASRLVKDIPERMVEEIMTEGTMMLSGVDLDVRFGEPIRLKKFLSPGWAEAGLKRQGGITGYAVSDELRESMRAAAYTVMQQYMQKIYSMTTVNQEHLFASILRLCPRRKMKEQNFRKRVFFVASILGDRTRETGHLYLHKSLEEDQAHLLTDDRYKKFENFIRLAQEKGVITRVGNFLARDREKLSAPLGFHKGRIDNPIEVMANEIEPLDRLQSLLKRTAWLPAGVLDFTVSRYLYKREVRMYREACGQLEKVESKPLCSGRPFLLPAFRRKTGVVLIHSYLAVPREVRALGAYLQKQGLWVYGLRLPGHGTSAEDLAGRTFKEWVEAVETGYVLVRSLCDRVFMGGMSIGGNLALDLAGRVKAVDGVFAVCPPFSLNDYSLKFMPGRDGWHRMLSRLKAGGKNNEYLDFSHGNQHVNYPINPVSGMKEVGELLESIEPNYRKVTQPTLVLQADLNPVVAPEGSRKLFSSLGSRKKEFCMMSFEHHILVDGEGREKVFEKIGKFIRQAI
jgi:esterase/lipase/1-acyl-sn-glycerol-3-phosphate acyltransferase